MFYQMVTLFVSWQAVPDVYMALQEHTVRHEWRGTHTLLPTTVTPGSSTWCEPRFHLYRAFVRTTNELLVNGLETCLPVKGQIDAPRRGKEELCGMAAKQQ